MQMITMPSWRLILKFSQEPETVLSYPFQSMPTHRAGWEIGWQILFACKTPSLAYGYVHKRMVFAPRKVHLRHSLWALSPRVRKEVEAIQIMVMPAHKL